MSGSPADAIGALQAACDAVDAALAALPLVEAGTAAEVKDALTVTATLDRLADAALVRVAGIVTTRSEDPASSVADAHDHPDARTMLHVATGHRMRHVKHLQALAAATSSSVSLTGAPIDPGYPSVAAGLESGAVSLDQAEAIVTNLDKARKNPAAAVSEADFLTHEQMAVAAATGDLTERRLSAEDTAAVARNLRDRLDPDGLEPRYRDLVRQRYLRAGERSDGSVAGSFLFPPREGAQLLQALTAFGKPGTKPRFLTAEEAEDLEASSTDGLVNERTTEQRNADTIAGLIAAGLEAADTPRIGGQAPTLVVTVTQGALDAHAAGETRTDTGEPVAATIEHTGGQIPVSEAETIACDGHVQVVFADHHGHPLHLARTSRLFTVAIRRAVATRDQRCVGCGKPPGFCQVHHITWWVDGGPTDIDNALLVCDWCHHQIHRRRLHPRLGPDGRWRLHTRP